MPGKPKPMMAAEPTTIVVVNQYYAPDVSSTGHLLAELAHELSRQGLGVHVVTAHPTYGPKKTRQATPAAEKVGGIEITRLPSTRFSKDHLAGRLSNGMTFFAVALTQVMRERTNSVILCGTNPPWCGTIGLAEHIARGNRYFVLLHDAYPEIANLVGTIRAGGLIDRAWRRINRRVLRHASGVIVLCEAAKELVCRGYDVPTERVFVIHNWADPEALRPRQKSQSAFALAHGLVEPFVLLYSGNLGLYYEWETLLEGAQRLRGEAFRLVLIGSGGRRNWLMEQISRRDLKNVQLHDYQPFDCLEDSLNACDASLVTIARGVEGISFPSKLYSSLAMGRPIVAISESGSELRRIVEYHRVGWWIEVGDGDGLAAIVRSMMADPRECQARGLRARELLERQFTLRHAAARYREVLTGMTEDDMDIGVQFDS